ncbi:hypothetical protein ACP0HM_01045 [Escherichia coli]
MLRDISRNTSQKNIDGYALDGQLDNDTGRPLKDTAAAVTAWASTWRIPQFKNGWPADNGGLTVNYANCLAASALLMSLTNASRLHALPQTVVIFALYISAQGGANVPRDCQTVRVARSPSDEVNEYEEEVERVVGILRAASRRASYSYHQNDGLAHCSESAGR